MTTRKRTNSDKQNIKLKIDNTNPTKKKTKKNEGALKCFWWVSSSCFTSGTRRVNLVTIPVISCIYLRIVIMVITDKTNVVMIAGPDENCLY